MKKNTTVVIVALIIVLFMSFSFSAQGINPVVIDGGNGHKLISQSYNAGVADDFEVPPNKDANTSIKNQEVNVGITNQVVNNPIVSEELNSVVEFDTESILIEKEVLDPKKIYVKTNKKVVSKVQSAINDLKVKPVEIFSPVFSSVENLVVDPTIEDEKVVYSLAAKDINKPIFKEKEVVQPIFNLVVDEPVEFRLADNKIIINNEQIIDYKGIVREKEVIPPIEIEINSTITNGKVYNLKVIPKPKSSAFKFIYGEKEVIMPIYSDFKVEGKKLYLLNNNKSYDLRISPPEIYSAVHNLTVKEPKVVIKKLSLGIDDKKAVYNLKVEEPAKILWIIPWAVESKYLIDPTDGSVKLVDSPWYITNEKLNTPTGFKLNKSYTF